MEKCTDCGKDITSKITGTLCTGCFFAKRKLQDTQKAEDKSEGPKIENEFPHESKPILLGVKSQEENDPENPKHTPGLKKITTVPNDGRKYCQSCLERYGVLNPADREWTPGYFICQDCLTPLLEQQLDYDTGRVEIARKQLQAQPISNSPLLNQVYDLLKIPAEFRFNDANKVLQNRNDIYNYHAPAVVNKSVEEISQQIEVYSILLFQIKLAVEPLQQYIDKVKAQERSAAGLMGLEKSEKEFTKRAKSGVKLSQDEKMAKTLGIPVEKYREMALAARKTEFKKITGS